MPEVSGVEEVKKARPQKWLLVAGTRPEIIKLAPVLVAARALPGVEARMVCTGQHRELAQQALADFAITPDYDLQAMRENQNLAALSARILEGVSAVYAQEKPDAVIVQGDTTTSFIAALAAFYARIPVYHVEAGLRSGSPESPFPEEANRVLISHLARLHFAPTPAARVNLVKENIKDEAIHVTGNTGIDALLAMRAKLPSHYSPFETLKTVAPFTLMEGQKFILVTLHRRENFGEGVLQFCAAIRQIANDFPEVMILFPVHANPNVRDVVINQLGEIPNIKLLEPQAYLPFIWLMEHCRFIISDSGGIQEESTILGKPLIVTRDITERAEAIQSQSAMLAGTNTQMIAATASRLLTDEVFYRSMARASNIFGDGKAAQRITQIIYDQLNAARHNAG